MKKILIGGVFFLAATLVGMSQDSENRSRDQKERTYHNRYEQLAERLSLSEQQLADIKKIDKDHSAQMKEFRAKMKEERQKMLAERKKMLNERDEHIKKTLTEEQYQKLNELRANKQQRYKDRKHHRGGKRHHRRG